VYSGSDATNAKFNLIRANANGVAASVLNAEPELFSQASNLQGYIKRYDDDENGLISKQATEGQLKTVTSSPWQAPIFATMAIIATEVSSLGGFSGSAKRVAADTYSMTINETSINPDGIYTVTSNNYLATPGKSSYGGITIPAIPGYQSIPGQPLTLTTNHPAAFTFTGSVANVSSATAITLNKVGAAGNVDNMLIEVQATGYLLNSLNQLVSLSNNPIYGIYISIRNDRVIEGNAIYSLPNIDTSDNITYTCPNNTALSGTPTQILANAKTQCFEADLTQYKTQGLDIAFYDKNAGFNPANYLYRDATSPTATQQPPVGFLKSVQTEMYGNPVGAVQYQFPTRMPYGSNYLFNVYVENLYNTNGTVSLLFAIQNQQ
jgi:hypothetical protein